MPEKQVHHSTQEAVLAYYSSPPSPHSGGSSAASSFDELAKGLATGTLSRGKAIRWMGGALLGAALASLPGVAWANDDCRRLGRGCRRDSQCCSGNCIGQGEDKVCGCRADQTLCKKPRGEGRCVNLDRNERHCGSCFNQCPEGQECVEGMCSGGEPICDPPCTEDFECEQGNFCRPVCTPPCPEGTCTCYVSGDGSGNVCVANSTDDRVSSCDQCPPADSPEKTVCYDIAPSPVATFLFCAAPCPQQT